MKKMQSKEDEEILKQHLDGLKDWSKE